MRLTSIGLFLLLCLPLAGLRADSGEEILSKSRLALQNLQLHASGAAPILQQAKGLLVFPDVVKMGFAVSGQYGEGVLLVADEPQAYYVTAGSAFGLQLGVEYKSEVIAFLSDESLAAFRRSRGWEVGVDSAVAVLDPGAGDASGELASAQDVVGFIFSNEGLMADLSMEGARVVQIAR